MMGVDRDAGEGGKGGFARLLDLARKKVRKEDDEGNEFVKAEEES